MNELENALRDWDDPLGARDWELAERLIRMFREALPVEREPVEDVEAKATAEDLRLHEKCKTTWGAADFIERQQQQVTALSQQVTELKKEIYECELCPASLAEKATEEGRQWDWFTGYLCRTVHFCPVHKRTKYRGELFELSQVESDASMDVESVPISRSMYLRHRIPEPPIQRQPGDEREEG